MFMLRQGHEMYKTKKMATTSLTLEGVPGLITGGTFGVNHFLTLASYYGAQLIKLSPCIVYILNW